ncbi:Peroxisomal membrane protein PEX16 [Chionoecetes opilio]|uniref:Peroxisomal membrane protein PEX16 n=1 Tax=Chionoecetes opilio TaxID=41210 RepID=A0A8J4XSM4_CHIOP|nr:Peroxisomal membrane protein PEX16 [Chionoecetes opilio]
MILTALECVEVLAEVSASQIWGEMGRWAVVAAIQLTKCIGRFMLLLCEKGSCVVSSPPIKPLDRRTAVKARQQRAMVASGPQWPVTNSTSNNSINGHLNQCPLNQYQLNHCELNQFSTLSSQPEGLVEKVTG